MIQKIRALNDPKFTNRDIKEEMNSQLRELQIMLNKVVSEGSQIIDLTGTK